MSFFFKTCDHGKFHTGIIPCIAYQWQQSACYDLLGSLPITPPRVMKILKLKELWFASAQPFKKQRYFNDISHFTVVITNKICSLRQKSDSVPTLRLSFFFLCSIDSTNSHLWNNLQLIIPIITIMKPEWMTLWFHLTRKDFFRYSGPWSDNHSSRRNCVRYNIQTGKFPAWYHTRSCGRLNLDGNGNEKFEKSWRDLVESQNRQILDYVEDKIKANEMESNQSRNQTLQTVRR